MDNNPILISYLAILLFIFMLLGSFVSSEIIEIKWVNFFSAIYGISSSILYFLIRMRILSGFSTPYIKKYEAVAYSFVFILLLSGFALQLMNSLFKLEISNPLVDIFVIITNIILISILPFYLGTEHGFSESIQNKLKRHKIGQPTSMQYGKIYIHGLGALIMISIFSISFAVLFFSITIPPSIDVIVSITFLISNFFLLFIWDVFNRKL